jgi:hypothetical protein
MKLGKFDIAGATEHAVFSVRGIVEAYRHRGVSLKDHLRVVQGKQCLFVH